MAVDASPVSPQLSICVETRVEVKIERNPDVMMRRLTSSSLRYAFTYSVSILRTGDDGPMLLEPTQLTQQVGCMQLCSTCLVCHASVLLYATRIHQKVLTLQA